MKFKRTSIAADKLILANDHYVAIPYDCSEVSAEENGVIPAGTIIPANDSTAIGVPKENPNGAVVIHGFIETAKLPTAPESDAKTAMKQITFLSATE